MHARIRPTTAAALALLLTPGLLSVPCPAVPAEPDSRPSPPGAGQEADAAAPAAAARTDAGEGLALAAALTDRGLDRFLTAPVHVPAPHEPSHPTGAIAILARRSGAGRPLHEPGGVILARVDVPASRAADPGGFSGLHDAIIDAPRAADGDGLHGPADARPVAPEPRGLQVASDAGAPPVSWPGLWCRHGPAFLAIALAMGLILPLSLALGWRNRQLHAARATAEQAERRWVLALDGAGQGVWDWDLPSGRVFYSRQWKAMLGYAPHELSNRLEEWRIRVHPEDLPAAEAAIERHCRGETPTLRVIYRMLAKDGSLRWILDQGMAFTRNADGWPLRMVGTHTDITAWRAAEDALAAQQALFAAVVSQARDGVVIVDQATQGFVEFNDAACGDLGYSREAFARLRLADIQAEFDQADIDARFDAVVAAGHGSFVTRHRHRDGRLLLAAIWADITEQEAAARALRESETRFRATFEQAAVGMAHVGVDGRWLRVNQALCDSLGYGREDLLATDFQHLTHADDLDADRDLVARALAGEIQSFSVEKRYLRRDGSAFWVEVTGSLVRADDGTPAYFIAVVEDIDQRRRDAMALAEISTRYLSLVENMRDGVAIFRAVEHGADFRFVVINRAGARVLGLPPAAFAGQRLSMLFPTIGETGLPETLREVWRSGEPRALPATEYRDQRIALWWESYLYRLPSSEVVAVFADVTAQKAAEQALLDSEATLQQLAYFDSLTGLPNRRLLLDRLEQALAVADREHRGLAVCSLDLDSFKPINERYGEAVGDRLLVAVGERLRELLGPGHTVARWGGDEFALLLTDIDGVAGCEALLTRVLGGLAEPFPIRAGEQGLSACIGVALYPQDQGDGDALLRHADHAMFLAKQRGQGGYQFFDPESDALAGVRREELRRIGAAIEGGELRLHYQPIVNMRSGTVVAVEALVRWQDPVRGLLAPAHFVPRIEGTALIRQLDAWVLARALADLAGWIDRGLPLQLHVNVSATTLTGPGFIDQLRRLVGAWPQVMPPMIDIEVLETAALADLEAVTNVIRAGRALGFRFALDDFGTGYSSLTYVRRLPADTLKIDQTFVRDMLDDHNDQHIVEAVIGLARAFDRGVVAEGVESDAHGVLLLRFGCEQAQGFGIARPMPAAQVPGWIDTWQAPAPWRSSASRPWPLADQPLLSMEAEHRGWVAAVLARARGEAGVRAEPLDEHQCRFGRWYDGEGQRRYGHLEAFRAIAPLHAEVHRLGGALLADGGAADQTGVDALARASEELIERIKRIEDAVNARAAALFADAGGAEGVVVSVLGAPPPSAPAAPPASGDAAVAAGPAPEVPGCTCRSA